MLKTMLLSLLLSQGSIEIGVTRVQVPPKPEQACKITEKDKRDCFNIAPDRYPVCEVAGSMKGQIRCDKKARK